MKKDNALRLLIKTAAVSGISLVWVSFTIEAFKFALHLVSTLPGDKTWNSITKPVCGHCQELYDDDEYHLIHGTHLLKLADKNQIKKNNLFHIPCLSNHFWKHSLLAFL